MRDATLPCTVFPDVGAKTKEERPWSLDLLDEEVQWPNKNACPLVKLAVFGDNLTSKASYRCDANVLGITGAEGDYDAGDFSMDKAVAAFEMAGIDAVFYTSASHTPEKPRWRILLPFSKQYTGTEAELRSWRTAALRKAESIIGTQFASESYTLSQSYYIGQVKGTHFDHHYCEGTPIDQVVDITDTVVVEPLAQSAPMPACSEEAQYFLEHVPPDCDYSQWLHVGMALRDKFGDDGFALWDAWSASSDKYPGEAELWFKWDSFSGKGITYSSLAKLAQEKGADVNKFGGADMGLIFPGDGIDQEGGFPHMKADSKGNLKPLATIENLRALMQAYGITVAYNIIQKRVEVGGIKHLIGEGANAAAAELLSKANLHGLSDKVVANYLGHIASESAFNPVLEWLESLPSEPIACPVAEYTNRCKLANPQWATVALSRWLIQAVAAADYAARTPNKAARPEFAYTLVLIGAQGTGKTSGMRKLLPESMQEYFSAGKTLDTSKKDSHLEAVSNWIVELGEIDATFRKSDIAALKSFLSNPADEIRKPYARASSVMARQTCYTATVNVPKFLQDATGNRRYWPIELLKEIPDMPEDLITRLWQWAWQSYLAGEQWWPTAKEETLHSAVISQHEDRPLVERVLDCYDFESDYRGIFLTPTEILQEIGWKNISGAQSLLGRMLNKELGILRRTATARDYAMPPRTSANQYNDYR
jgi:hypothetical protein